MVIPMIRIGKKIYDGTLILLPVLGVIWVLAIPERLGVPIVVQQFIAVMLGLAAAGSFLKSPYLSKIKALDILLSLAVGLSWFWYAWNFQEWMVMMAYRTPDMWIPGVIALALLLEALRKALGLTIALLVAFIVLYGFIGDLIPGALSAQTFAPTKTILFLYADTNGVPGLVARIILELVLPFVIFGKIMEVAGGMKFFNDLALGIMGHRRGGPAKVAVVASGSFGTLSGSTVANIMSTGIITIPLMKRTGFRPAQAGAIEAVASNGAQMMPPVMGATAFIIAEFLQVPYGDVVLAAIAPALLYYLVLFLKIDSIAIAEDISGLPKAEIPSVGKTLSKGWVFVIPLGFLVYFLFWQGLNPGLAALYATATLGVTYLVQKRGKISLKKLPEMLKGAGEDIIPILLIGGAAGAVIGVMNSTGFAFQLSLLLTYVSEAYGLFVMLLLSAIVSIILGMGMPTSAVYIVLVTVIAPTLINLGVNSMGAHLFLFYFGLMSMITPPIAVGSMVAAQIAKANIWTTGFYGMRLGIAAYLLPFLWVFNPAVILNGTLLEIAIVQSNCIAAALLLRQSMLPSFLNVIKGAINAVTFMTLALVVGGATLWIGVDEPVAFLPSLLGPLAMFLEWRYRTQSYEAGRNLEKKA